MTAVKLSRPLARYYKIAPDRILVVYDDLDIPLGTIRFRPEGTSGGHRGVQSIINNLGDMHHFPGLRLGIGQTSGTDGSGRIRAAKL